jgi:hypothetical protein
MLIHIFSFLRAVAEVVSDARRMQTAMSRKHGWMAE